MAEISEKELEDYLVSISSQDGFDGIDCDELFIRGACFRQVRLGGYGIADLLYIDFEALEPQLTIDIIELKKNSIDMAAIGQLCRYRVGVERFMGKIKKRIKHLRRAKVDIFCTLIGKKYSGENTCFVADTLKRFNVYFYDIDLGKGIKFQESYGWHCNDENFKSFSKILRGLETKHKKELANWYKYQLENKK